MYLPRNAPRARMREAQNARNNRAEIVKALSNVSSLVAGKPTAANAQNVEATQSRKRSKYDPRPNPIAMAILDVAVVNLLQSNWMREWTQTDLAYEIAMRPEIDCGSEQLRTRALTHLREDNGRVANKLYHLAPRKMWRGRSDNINSLLLEKWGPEWQRNLKVDKG